MDYKLLALGLSVALFGFESYLNYRQHKRLLSVRKRTPEIEKIMTETVFKKTRTYALDKSFFNFFNSTFDQLLSMAFIWFNFLPYVWDLSLPLLKGVGFQADYTQAWEISHSLVFVILFTLVNQAIKIPFSLYSTFVIEQKHGFNNQTLSLFFIDLVKTNLLSIAIGCPVLSLLILIIRWTGDLFYFYVWLFVFVFQLLMMTIYPNFIQPLFNKVEPLPEGQLKSAIEDLAQKCEFPLTKLFIIDGSKRSNHSNAYFYGFFKNKRIVLFDTLIKQLSKQDDILAVLAHEIGHWFHNHVFWAIFFIEVHLFIIFYSFSLTFKNHALLSAFGFQQKVYQHYDPVLLTFLVFNLFMPPLESLFGFLMNYLSRRNEYQADQYAHKLGYSKGLIRALIQLSIENKGVLWPDAWFSAYHHSHPTVLERIQALGGLKVIEGESFDKEEVKEEDGDSHLTESERKEKYLFEKVLKKEK